MFDKKEIEFMQSLGIEADFENLSDNILVKIEDVVSDELQKSGFDENYKITDKGKMCESILDKLYMVHP